MFAQLDFFLGFGRRKHWEIRFGACLVCQISRVKGPESKTGCRQTCAIFLHCLLFSPREGCKNLEEESEEREKIRTHGKILRIFSCCGKMSQIPKFLRGKKRDGESLSRKKRRNAFFCAVRFLAVWENVFLKFFFFFPFHAL